ncbi:L,D-transpeptidase family protein [Hyphomicrobium sp. NDB2Meth4]|uniref:L,D-transpeptidase family protein n=1 Tax=Hyphomicrobium sp. NDB2Meth4 TaxID=1892846 RepID=UPI0009302780|nr:L,D-transpeptidase family protein [Hyphomicrobium sp. NDB2Meth4]
MIRSTILTLAAVLSLLSARAADAAAPPVASPPMASDPALAPPLAAPVDTNPVASAVRTKLNSLPAEGSAQEIKERAVLSDFYAARRDAPIWLSEGGLTERGAALGAEILNAADWGLDPKDFDLPIIPPAAQLSSEKIGKADVEISLALLKYARYARGGRITDPAILLNSNLDRKPQLRDPEVVFREAVGSSDPAGYLRSLHPQQPQFEKLRQVYLANKDKPLGKKIQANMEEWRWMPDDMGQVHILANVPEYLVYLYKDGVPIHSERIVVGETGKQTTIFTRNLKTVVFKPMWRVPDSIKAHELGPNLRRGGSMFRQYDLELQTKDGQPLDYRSIDWNRANILDYEVVQPPGRKNVMGVVKFTFPSQHTIFMHDTIDKWMFGQKVRTLSHGCLRLRNPMKMAELVLQEDRGWDAAKVDATMETGPRNNEIVLEKKIPMHLVYFTAWVDEKGKLQTFNDIYGHEKRITQALAGEWDKIDIGRNHLAPVAGSGADDPSNFNPAPVARQQKRPKQPSTIIDMVGNALGGGF